MVDVEEVVCCMCGDVGFSDKLFRCTTCCYRFQHLYCSNYYRESSEAITVCDWCKNEEKMSRSHSKSFKKPMARNFSGEKVIIQQHNGEDCREKGKNPATGAPSPRTSTRRYKLLKDVMC